VERVEALRNRIGGRGARRAFNRRIEAAQDVLRRDQEELARWDSTLQQLRRLERTADAAGVLSPDRILEEARALVARVELLRFAAPIEPIGDAATVLEALRESLDAAARRIASQSAGLDEATALVERFTNRAETEFMERKFSVAKLPCTVCRLVSATPAGVQYDVSYNSVAKTLLDQPELATLNRG
jgi:hypothetical protein